MKEVGLVLMALASATAASGEGKKDPFPPMVAPFVDLVADGKPVAAIVAPAEPSLVEGHAIQELRTYVTRMTGAELPIV